MKHIIISALLCLLPAAALAQEEKAAIALAEGDIACQAYATAQSREGVIVYFRRCNTQEIANDAMQELQFLQQQLLNGAVSADVRQRMEKKYADALVRHFGKVRQRSQRTGRFVVHNTNPGQGVLLMTAKDDDLDVEFATLAVVAGRTEYDVSFQGDANARKAMTERVHRLGGITKVERAQPGDGGTKRSPRSKGDYAVMSIPYRLNPEWWGPYSRMVLQSQVVECGTADVMAYLPPVVYEGDDFHTLQIRKKDYDYKNNDPLAAGLQHELPYDEATGQYVVNINQLFRKPDPNKLYDNIAYIWLEDKNRVYRRDTIPMTCMEENFARLLNFRPYAVEMPLYDEFYEEAQEQTRDVGRALNLQFVVGTARFTASDDNQRIMTALADELKSYGDLISNINITGSASPEGRVGNNTALARKRAGAAEAQLRQMLQGSSVRCSFNQKAPVVHTWAEVADTLAAQGDTLAAKALRDILATTKEATAYWKIRPLACYDSVVEPVLQRMRAMTCEYQYVLRRRWTPEEVVADFQAHKAQYANGSQQIPYEDGDLYNLFKTLDDDTDKDNLTRWAYDKLSRRAGYPDNSIMAPYVACRKAVMDLRAGIADTLTLRPFVNPNAVVENKLRDATGLTRTVNHHEILTNQALTYLSRQSTVLADSLSRRVINAPVDDYYAERAAALADGRAKAQRVQTLLDFIYLEGERPEDLTPVEREKLAKARTMVLADDENRAVMHTVLPKYYGADYDDTEQLLDLLPDTMAKKWYLKTILWSKKLADGSAAAPDGADAGTPASLAYLHHCITMQPRFADYYATDGYIPARTRTNYPYKRRDIPAYVRKFNELTGAAGEVTGGGGFLAAEGDVTGGGGFLAAEGENAHVTGNGGKKAAAPSYADDLIPATDTGRTPRDRSDSLHTARHEARIIASQYMLDRRFRPQNEEFAHRWHDGLSFGVGLGLMSNMPTAKGGSPTGPLTTVELSVAKRLTPVHSLRLTARGAYNFLHGGGSPFAHAEGNLDYLFNISSYVAGYRPDRFLEVSAVAGMGYGWTKIGRYHNQYGSWNAHVGAQVKFNCGPQGAFAIEPYFGIATNNMDLRPSWSHIDMYYGASASLIYYLHNSYSHRAMRRYGRESADSVERRKWQTPWFLEYANGLYMTDNRAGMRVRSTLGTEVAVSVGKWLAPAIGLRATVATQQFTQRPEYFANHTDATAPAYQRRTHSTFHEVRLEGMLNPFGFGKHFDWEQRFGGYLLLGAGIGTYNQYDRDGRRTAVRCVSYDFGLHAFARITERLAFFAEPRYQRTVYRQVRGGVGEKVSGNTAGASIGMTITTKPRYTWSRQQRAEADAEELRRCVVGGAVGVNFAQTRHSFSGAGGLNYNGLVFGEYRFTRAHAVRLAFEYVSHTAGVYGHYTDYGYDPNAPTPTPDPNPGGNPGGTNDPLVVTSPAPGTRAAAAGEPIPSRQRLGLMDWRDAVGCLSLSYQCNLSELLFGPAARRLSLHAFAGPTLYIPLTQSGSLDSRERVKEGHVAVLPGTMHAPLRVCAHMGAKLSLRVLPQADVFFAPTMYVLPGAVLQHVPFSNAHIMESLSLGMQYAF